MWKIILLGKILEWIQVIIFFSVHSVRYHQKNVFPEVSYLNNLPVNTKRWTKMSIYLTTLKRTLFLGLIHQ